MPTGGPDVRHPREGGDPEHSFLGGEISIAYLQQFSGSFYCFVKLVLRLLLA
jgi:hypothetical protein